MAEWVQVVPLLATTGVMGWAGNASLQWLKARGDRQQAREGNEIDLEQHRDKLTFDLLSAAQAQALSFLEELKSLRPLQSRVAQLEAAVQTHVAFLTEAKEVLRAVLESETPDDRRTAERRGRAFLTRMQRVADARGTFANEEQVEISASRLAGDAGDILGKLPD